MKKIVNQKKKRVRPIDETNKITVDENVNPEGVTQKQPLEVFLKISQNS